MTGETTTCDQSLILDWTSELQHYAIRNNGHSLVAIPFHIDSNGYGDISGLEVLHHTNDTKIRLRNSFYNTFKSPVNKEYCFDSLHFHWGSDNAHGSEHTVNGQEFPLELHLVHYSCDWYLLNEALYDYNSGEVAQRYDDDNILAVIGVLFEIGAPNPVLQQILNDVIIDGVSQFHDPIENDNVLAVIGVLFEIGAPNPVLQQILNDVIIDGVSQFHDPIEKFGDHLLEIFYDEFDIADLLPDNREVIAYEGSLTTPPCFETVRWHVMKHRMTVSEAQMDQFRVLLRGVNTTNSVAPNFRPVQELNDRQIFHCEEDVDALAVTKDTAEANNGDNGDGSNPDDTDGYTGISGTEQTHCEEDVDALAVTKDAASNTDGDGSNPDGDDTDGYTGISGTEQTW
eukprot:CAMPEP_0201592214 /NCGR_PEP_ID=MMETSP0190_2-20130828/190162_1 /ASSEMBLY_ACC=CAM_ASM_000263 /TAXON_ID=37353 /ORGANISM="Rosalina sp." /LENGTH=398 /DNA_ID=CAMNT_0048050869 /DNA_START=206 /DNA_END=1399 /DNA_ORIENTATION=-